MASFPRLPGRRKTPGFFAAPLQVLGVSRLTGRIVRSTCLAAPRRIPNSFGSPCNDDVGEMAFVADGTETALLLFLVQGKEEQAGEAARYQIRRVARAP
jgi:hypothetical protein